MWEGTTVEITMGEDSNNEIPLLELITPSTPSPLPGIPRDETRLMRGWTGEKMSCEAQSPGSGMRMMGDLDFNMESHGGQYTKPLPGRTILLCIFKFHSFQLFSNIHSDIFYFHFDWQTTVY